MMLLSKLKAAGAGALAVLALSGGLGYGPGLVRAGDGPGSGDQGVNTPRSPKNEDAAFLDRLSTELRGDKATPVEHGYFAADADAAKRKKVVAWFLADDAVKAHQARKHGAEGGWTVDVTGIAFAPDGRRLAAFGLDNTVRVWDLATNVTEATTGAFLLGDVVNSDAGLAGTITLNERNFDAARPGQAVVDYDNDGKADVVVFKYPAAKDAAVVRGLNYLKRVAGDPPAGQVTPATPGTWLAEFKLGQPAAEQHGFQSYSFIPGPGAVNPGALGWVEEHYVEVGDGQPAADPNATAPRAGYYRVLLRNPDETDEAFLERAVKAARGTAPSEVEKKYFAADKDPNKRAKLLDLLLADPAVAKKLGDDWKKGMLAPPATAARLLKATLGERLNPNTTARLTDLRSAELLDRNTTARLTRSPDGVTYEARLRPQFQELAVWRADVTAPPDKFGKLVDELLGAKRTDEQVLEAVTLAAAGRLPTDPEKRLVLATIGKAADKKAAWVEVAKALAPADEKKDEPKK